MPHQQMDHPSKFSKNRQVIISFLKVCSRLHQWRVNIKRQSSSETLKGWSNNMKEHWWFQQQANNSGIPISKQYAVVTVAESTSVIKIQDIWKSIFISSRRWWISSYLGTAEMIKQVGTTIAVVEHLSKRLKRYKILWWCSPEPWHQLLLERKQRHHLR